MYDIRDMHYDFKIKYNKIDSAGNEDLQIPEIDWLLNEALEIYVRNIAEPFFINKYGMELNQRTIDSISQLVKTAPATISNSFIELPVDYWYFLSGRVIMSKGICKNKKGILLIRQHDDVYDIDTFYDSSFEWREVSGVFESSGIKVLAEGFTVDSAELSYIKRHPYMHFAEGFRAGEYTLPNGTALTGREDCILPSDVAKDIVDIATLIAAQNTGLIPSYNLKLNKLKLKQITNE